VVVVSQSTALLGGYPKVRGGRVRVCVRPGSDQVGYGFSVVFAVAVVFLVVDAFFEVVSFFVVDSFLVEVLFLDDVPQVWVTVTVFSTSRGGSVRTGTVLVLAGGSGVNVRVTITSLVTVDGAGSGEKVEVSSVRDDLVEDGLADDGEGVAVTVTVTVVGCGHHQG
jgi:hypothetical protein